MYFRERAVYLDVFPQNTVFLPTCAQHGKLGIAGIPTIYLYCPLYIYTYVNIYGFLVCVYMFACTYKWFHLPLSLSMYIGFPLYIYLHVQIYLFPYYIHTYLPVYLYFATV